MPVVPVVPDLVPIAVAAASLVAAIAAAALGALALRRVRRLEDHYEALMVGVDGSRLSSALEAHVRRVAEMERRVLELERQVRQQDERLRKAIQRVRILRYRAFEDAGGDQSFAIALLDDDADGIVVSGLYGRGGVRVYAKPVEDGSSTYALTAEEERVIREAGSSDGGPAGPRAAG